MDRNIKPPRTFGLSIAILASIMLLSVLPLLQVSLLYAVQYRFSNVSLPGDRADQDDIGAFATGGSFEGITDSALLLQVVLGLAYLPLGIMAWRGRPRSIRFVVIAVVIGLTALTAITTAISLANPPSVQTGIDSGRDLERTLLISRTAFSALIALYVAWYMNRGPARAFYRGYYLPDPETETSH